MVRRRIAELILRLTPKKLRLLFESSLNMKFNEKIKYSQFSFSQEGEDILLSRFFENKSNGFYVDIGAHHPKRFSNTYIFYKKGWRGINIDPIPGMLSLFEKERNLDINLEMGIYENKGQLTYYMFNEPALNTFSEKEAISYDSKPEYYIKEKRSVNVDTLENILDKHLPIDIEIDFLTIDAEGLDFMVLKSNNFDKYKPKLILVEMLDLKSMDDIYITDLYDFLNKKNYVLYSKTVNTVFFLLK